MKTYEAIYNPLINKGVYGISLVKNPAMQGHYIALSEDVEVKFKTQDEEKRVLIGLALEPNKPIYRNQDGEEFNIVFSEETIRNLSYDFYKNGFQQNSTLEHSEAITGVTFVESWIVEDSNNDKSSALGFSYPKGSWMVAMKVEDDDLWNDYVKTGKVKGFSIDALLSLKEVKFKSDINMSVEKNPIAEAIETGFNKFFQLFKNNPKGAIELGEVKTDDGKATIHYEGDEPVKDGEVWILADDGETKVALPAGEYTLEDKRVLVVVEDGKVSEIKDAPTEEKPAETTAKPAEVEAKEADAIAKGVESGIKKIMIQYHKENQETIAKLKADFDAKILELSSAPAAKPVKGIPEQAPKTSKDRILQTIQEQD